MKFLRISILSSAILLLAGAAPESQPSSTRSAGCDVAIWSSLDWRDVLYAGHSTLARDDVRMELCRKMGPAAKEALGIDPDALQEYVTFSPTNVARSLNSGSDFSQANKQDGTVLGQGPGEQTRMELSLNLDDKAKPAAREFLDQMIDALPLVIDGMQRADLQTQFNHFESQRQHYEDSRNREKELNAQMQNLGIADRTPQGIQSLAHNLDEQRQQLTLETAALSAQLGALAKAIERISAESKAKAQDDPVANELETISNVKEKKLDMLKTLAPGNVAANDVSDAEAAAAEARVQLLERREAVARAAGGDALAEFEKQSVLLEVNVAQDRARLGAIDQQSKALIDAQELATQMQELNRPGSVAIDEINQKIRELNSQLDQIPKCTLRVISKGAK